MGQLLFQGLISSKFSKSGKFFHHMQFPFALLSLVVSAHAAFNVSNVFGSGMVLQRDQPGLIWGFSTQGIVVSSNWFGAPISATTGADGVWRLGFPSTGIVSTPFNMTFSSPGASDVIIDDILVGDVILCSGQSK